MKKYFISKIIEKMKIFCIPILIIPLSILHSFLFLKNYEFIGRIEKTIEQMYNEDDLSSCSLFAGHYINFGFWKNNKIKSNITLRERIESQKNLYRIVLNYLKIDHKDKVLEVGCGLGVGTVLTYSEYKPKKIIGIDLSKAQISRANQINRNIINKNGNILFKTSVAEKLSGMHENFDIIFTIEAAQHFDSIGKFINESYKILNPKGKLAIATFFGKTKKSSKQLQPFIQTVKQHIDHIHYIDDIKWELKKAGYQNIQIISIGINVWPYFDKWVSQTELKDSWTRNWKKGWENKLIDYYIILAEKHDYA